jgi:hypothetical protein
LCWVPHERFVSPQKGSEEEKKWRRQNPKGYKLHETEFTTGSTPLHQAANKGDADSLKQLLGENGHLINARDINGWMPIHVSFTNSDEEFHVCHVS